MAHADGTVLHRYGGRDERGADVWLGRDSFVRFLRIGLASHAEHAPRSDRREASAPAAPLVLEDVPSFAKRDKGECIHCHSVFPALYEEAVAKGTWRDDDRWVYPSPRRIGIDLDRDAQGRVRSLEEGSVAASAAGLRVGDELVSANGVALASASDLSRVLHELPTTGGALALELVRDGETRRTTLALADGWKRGTPLEFSWRPFKWGFTPAPGFGGARLDAEDLRALGLAADAFAFRVDYLVTWGENARFGRAALRAGLRKGDVVVSLAGRSDFASVDHVHAWWRLTRVPGDTVRIEVRRPDGVHALELEVVR